MKVVVVLTPCNTKTELNLQLKVITTQQLKVHPVSSSFVLILKLSSTRQKRGSNYIPVSENSGLLAFQKHS
jgi:hypothetical protein